MRLQVIAGALLLGAGLASTSVLAEDWTAGKLRGHVLVSAGGQWVPLQRGQTAADRQYVRTMADGAVEFTRNGETIALSPNTQVEISEQAAGRYTVVAESFGQVSIADNHTALPHFAVNTPYVAAVVKGTVFTVISRPGGSQVLVDRGEVNVEDLRVHTFVNLLPDQHANVTGNQPMSVGGSGTLQPITDARGQVVSVPTAGGEAAAAGSAKPAKASAKAPGKPAPGPGGPAAHPGPGGPAAKGPAAPTPPASGGPGPGGPGAAGPASGGAGPGGAGPGPGGGGPGGGPKGPGGGGSGGGPKGPGK
jgi:hypothetical protein